MKDRDQREIEVEYRPSRSVDTRCRDLHHRRPLDSLPANYGRWGCLQVSLEKLSAQLLVKGLAT
jgi:hypothetical protein